MSKTTEMVAGAKGSRLIENLALLAGVVVALVYGIAEALARIGLSLGEQAHADHGIPWGLVIIVGACILPKSIGKATTGKLWEAVASRVSGKG